MKRVVALSFALLISWHALEAQIARVEPPSGPAEPSPSPPPSAARQALPVLAGSGTGAALFHHLHLVTTASSGTVDFYQTLFRPDTIVRGRFWLTDGVRGDDAFLLVSQPRARRGVGVGRGTAIWHFGWGKVSVGETYQEHLINGVNWQPPYPSLTTELHVHLRSRDPLGTAEWYETVLGATREASRPPTGEGAGDASGHASSSADGADEGRVEAIVRIDKITLVIHQTEMELVSTRTAGVVDHLSFQVPDVKEVAARARDSGIRLLDLQHELPDIPSVMLEGPDGIVLELLERPKGPVFWHERP